MKFSSKTVSHKTEEIIVAGLIMNDELCKRLLPKIDESHFKSKPLKTVVTWIKNFHSRHEKAPKSLINEILDVEKDNLRNKPDDIEIIESVLQRVSDKLEEEETYNNAVENVDFIYNSAITYLNKRDLEVRAERILDLLGKEEVQEAKEVMQGYKETYKGLVDDGNPFTQENFGKVMLGEDSEDPNVILRFHNALDRSVGPLKRGWFVSFIGPMKSGKTFFLMDWSVRAMMQGCNVLYFNLEVPQQDFDERLFQMVASKPIRNGSFNVPVFDCVSNQDDSCKIPQRTKEIQGKKFPCTYCRDHSSDSIRVNYKPTSFLKNTNKRGLLFRDIAPSYKSRGLNIQKYAGQKFRRYSPYDRITMADIEGTIQDLNYLEGWIPDVIVTDYADLMTTNVKGELRHQLDDIWLSHRMLAKKYNALVLSATQTNREGTDIKTIREKNIAEDIRKLSHVTMMLGINRYRALNEQSKGICRINAVRHRNKDMNIETLCLQCLDFSNPCLDTINITWDGDNYVYVGR